jgi:hypothetical protein
LARLNATQRADEAQWAQDYEAARGESTKGGFLVGVVGWLGWSGILLLLGVVVFCPTALKVVAFLIGRYKATKTALEDVVGGVQAVLDEAEKVGSSATVKKVLAGHRSLETRAEIRKTKIRLGLPVEPKEIDS